MKSMPVTALKERDQWVCWDDSSGRKVPINARGGPASSTDPKTWSSYLDALECSEIHGYSGVGFVFTEDDCFCGVDIDDCVGPGDKVDESTMSLIKALDSYCEYSPSGTGVKIFGLCDKQYKGRNEDGLEYYTKGRYFTFTEDPLHVEDMRDLSSFFERQHSEPEHELVETTTEEDYGEERLYRAERYLDSVKPSVEGQGGDLQLYMACVRLVQDFNLSNEDATKLLVERYNPRCTPPWDVRDIEYKVDWASQKKRVDSVGRLNDNSKYVTVSEADELSASILINKRQESLPDHLTWLPSQSPMSMMFDYIMSTSARENRALAFSGALAWYCGLIGGKVMDESGVTSNLYTVTLAPSSGGKQAPQDAIRSVTDASDWGEWLGGKVTSDSAIGAILKQSPNALCLWDEVGLFLQKSKGGVQATITDLLLDLWGSTNSKFRLKQYADSERDIVIDKPCFGFAGWSTAEHFWAGLNKMHLHDGFAGRLLVINTGERSPRKRKVYQDPPRPLVQVANVWNKKDNVFEEVGVTRTPRKIMKVSEEAEEVFDALWDKVEEFTDNDEQAVWGRAPEKARKIALAFAATRGPESVVGGEQARRACELVDYVTETFMREAKVKLMGGETHNEVRRDIITELRRRNGTCYAGSLLRSVNTSSRVFETALKTMEDVGQIKVAHESGGKRKVVYCG